MKIVYKILNTLVSLLVVPILVFLPMFRFIMTIGMKSENQLLSILGSFLNVEELLKTVVGLDLTKLPEKYSLADVYNLFFGETATIALDGFDKSVIPEAMTKYFFAAGILFLIGLVFVVVVVIIGLFTNKKGIAALFSALGFASVYASGKCFSHIASQIVSGKMSLVQLIAGIPSFTNYDKYIQYINIDVRTFDLDIAFSLVLAVIVALFMLNIFFMVYDQISDKPQNTKARSKKNK